MYSYAQRPPLGPTCFEHKTTFICKAYLPVWRNKSVHLQKPSRGSSSRGWARGRLLMVFEWAQTPMPSTVFFPTKTLKTGRCYCNFSSFTLTFSTPIADPQISSMNIKGRFPNVISSSSWILDKNIATFIQPVTSSQFLKKVNPQIIISTRRDLLWEFILHCSKPSSGLQVFFSSHTQWQLNSKECVMVKPPEGQKMMVKIPRCFCQNEARHRLKKNVWQQKEWSFSRKNRIRFRVFGCLFRLKSKEVALKLAKHE